MARKLIEMVQLKLRFREELRRKLEKAAERSDQSLNSEIITRLERSFDAEDRRNVVREMADQFNAYIAESAELDRKTLKMLVGGDSNTMLLRMIAKELTDNPDWFSSYEGKTALSDRISAILALGNFSPEGPA